VEGGAVCTVTYPKQDKIRFKGRDDCPEGAQNEVLSRGTRRGDRKGAGRKRQKGVQAEISSTEREKRGTRTKSVVITGREPRQERVALRTAEGKEFL